MFDPMTNEGHFSCCHKLQKLTGLLLTIPQQNTFFGCMYLILANVQVTCFFSSELLGKIPHEQTSKEYQINLTIALPLLVA